MNEDADLVIRSEAGSKQVAGEIPSCRRRRSSLERTAITLHEELLITPI
jgi:hypothetical protein